MLYESIIRNDQKRLRLPFAGLPMLIHVAEVRISPQERPALENMNQFLSTMVILRGSTQVCLSQYGEDTWVNVPFHVLFVDTQSVVLFLRQFMEDAAFIIRAVLPPTVRGQMPAGFTDLVAQIIDSGPERDPGLAAVCPSSDPLRRFLVDEESWFREAKDLRDDICHRSAYGRLRTATFPNTIDLVRAGGGKAAFASESDLRHYLCGLFQRWLAFANLVGQFVERRVREDHPDQGFANPGGFVIAEGEFDLFKSTKEPLFPVGTTVMTFSKESIESLEDFVGVVA